MIITKLGVLASIVMVPLSIHVSSREVTFRKEDNVAQIHGAQKSSKDHTVQHDDDQQDGGRAQKELNDQLSRAHNAEQIQSLLKQGAQPNGEVPGIGRNALQVAAIQGDVEAVRMYLRDAEIDLNRSFNGTTALHESVMMANNKIVQLLLDAGVDPNLRDNLLTKNTPLHTAVHSAKTIGSNPTRYVTLVKLLKSKGADIKAKNYWGYTVYKYAQEGLCIHKDILQALNESESESE